MKAESLSRAVLCASLLLAGCGAPDQRTPSAAAERQTPRPVVVQGAMPVETERLASRLDGVTEERVGGWTFWRGTLDGYPVVVSKTLKGMSSAAAATAIAIERYRPVAIVNQGTAGGHDPELRVGDIVIGRDSVNLGAFKTAVRPPGKGSDSLEWTPMDLLASEGSASDDPNARTMRRFPADEKLVAAAESVKQSHRSGRVVTGVIGSSDVWNSEIDRIQRFRAEYGTSVEEMETAAAAQVAGRFGVPFLGVRILSNNITNDGAYDGKTGVACQEFVYEVVRAYIGTVLKNP